MIDKIRVLVAKHARLPIPITTLGNDQDLYVAGLTSFASVQLMLALEDGFDVEFPEQMLNNRSFASIDAIARCIQTLTTPPAFVEAPRSVAAVV